MTKMLARLPLAAIVAGIVTLTVPALAATHTAAKVTLQQARQIALTAYPGGKIIKEELEHEAGGTGLRYSFDMKQGREWRELGVDAVTGKVLENSVEGANPKD